jgi:peroxiredoxin
LADFQRHIGKFGPLNTRIVALSVDDLDDARKTVEKHELDFPVLYGLDAAAVSEKTGAYINEDPPYLHATGFVLDPEGTIAQAVYSSGPIGRLTAQDTAGLIEHKQKD